MGQRGAAKIVQRNTATNSNDIEAALATVNFKPKDPKSYLDLGATQHFVFDKEA